MAWLNTWSYRKTVTIKHETGAGEDYQVNFSIGDGSGGDFTLPKCDVFPQDIQVTGDDGETPLDYWVEDLTLDPISMWVEVADDLSTDDVDICFYYGKSGESSASNITTTFIFGNDFESGLGAWTTGAGSWSTEVKDGSTAAVISPAVNHDILYRDIGITEYIMEVKTRKDVAGGFSGFAVRYDSQADFWVAYLRYSYQDLGITSMDDSVWGAETRYGGDMTLSPNIWYNIKFTLTGNDFLLLVDDTYSLGGSSSTHAANTGVGLWVGAAIDIWFDNFRVRKYAATEPAFLSAGAEESAPGIGAQSQILNPWGFNKYGAVIG